LKDSFTLHADPTFIYWLLILCVLLWYSTSFHRGIWVGMPLAAVILFIDYRLFDADPGAELQDLIDHISGAFYNHITHPGEAYPYANAAGDHTFVLLLLGFFLAAYLTTALHSRGLRISLSMLETLPIFIACVMVNGKMPTLPSLGMLLFWFLLLVGGKGFNPNSSAYRTLACCLLPVALLLGILLLRHRPEDYVFTNYDRQLNERFEGYTRYFDLLTGRRTDSDLNSPDPSQGDQSSAPRSSFQNSWDTADSSMNLSSPFDESKTDLRLMEIQAETTGQLYLRTRSYGDYVGTGWLPAEELSSGSSLPFVAFAAEESPYGIKRETEIHTYLDLPALCIPYYAAVSTGSDAAVSAQEQINYRVTYVDYHSSVYQLSVPGQAAEAEALYRSHAHSVYTRLPDSTREAALEICAGAGLHGDDPEIVQAVAEYVQGLGEYDLQVGALPSDDYAIYFLTESPRGYCIHYASAAAVLYRALGIPARVTEGFVAQTKAGAFREVLAGDAHAWVEVYLDGIGWIPVEVTTRAGFATSPSAPSPSPVPIPENQPVENAEPSQDPAAKPTEVPGGGDNGGKDGGDGPGDGEGPGSSFPWWLLLILPGLVLLFALWYLLAKALFRLRVQNADSRRAVIACWRYASRAASFGGEMPEDIQHFAEKVAFSPHPIHRDELVLCRNELRELIDKIYPVLNPLRKFLFRFLYGMK
jgi:hypothetical protein